MILLCKYHIFFDVHNDFRIFSFMPIHAMKHTFEEHNVSMKILLKNMYTFEYLTLIFSTN